MTNARSARAWFEAEGGRDVARHFAALTTNVEAARELRHHHHLRFLGLGGRPLFAVVGHRPADRHRHRRRRFSRTAGRRACDGPAFRHGAAGAQPAGAAGAARRLVPQFPRLHQPQHRALSQRAAPAAGLPAAAGNGKQRQARRPRTGSALGFATSPVLWGEPGTNGQHAYFQMLHQGTDVVPVEFIAVRQAVPRPAGPSRAAAGQRAGPGPGADAGQARRRRPPGFPGQPPQHLLPAGRGSTRPAWARCWRCTSIAFS